MYNYLGSFGIIVLIFQVVYILFIIYFIVHEIIKLKNEKWSYFKKFWNFNDLIIISFSIVATVMYVMRTVFTTLAIKSVFESELGEFVNFNTIGVWDMVFSNISSVVVFCSTLKFLKLLRFNNKIGMLSATLRKASKDLFGFSLTFVVIFLAFTQFSYLVFGIYVKSYKNFVSSLASIFRFSLGQFNLKELQHANYVLGSAYFILFILIVIMGLMSMFITILNDAFEEVKRELQNKANEYEIIEYVFEKVKNIKNLNGPKKRRPNKIGASSMNIKDNDINQLLNASVDVSVKEKKEFDYSAFYSSSMKSLNFDSTLKLSSYHDDSLSMY